jgi:ABC-type Mn2+/Zn2+ transport system ATPase subunit
MLEIEYRSLSQKENRYHFENQITQVFGPSGSGKSFLMRSLFTSIRLQGPHGCVNGITTHKQYFACFIDSRNLVDNTNYLPTAIKRTVQYLPYYNETRTLSNGQAFRLYLDYALQVAEIIFIDEGFGALDLPLRQAYIDKCVIFLRRRQTNKIIYASHIEINKFKNTEAKLVLQ